MEEYLGRDLLPEEDVHHINGDVTDNSIENLKILKHGEYQRQHAQKYFDTIETCQVCGKEFLWTGKRQRGYFADIRRGKQRIISCSRECSSFFGRMVQLNRDDIASQIKGAI